MQNTTKFSTVDGDFIKFLSNLMQIFIKIFKDQILQHFDDAKCCYLVFPCFDFCKSWRAVDLFSSNAQCVGCSSIWIELLFEEALFSAGQKS
jgi:hypothetical protein